MIKLFNILDKTKAELDNAKIKDIISDFAIKINTNNYISVYIISDKDCNDLISQLESNNAVDVTLLTESEYEEDKEYYSPLFSEKDRINDYETRRRLSNMLSDIPKIDNKIPVYTFYSYKGGVGRSTALASFASYMAIHHRKKVVILDCDFEAPGFTNFYVDDYDAPIFNEGLVEYFIDSQFGKTELSGYYWVPSNKFSGDGEIYVFPSGNLENAECIKSIYSTNLKHYLNGLSRLDFMSPDVIVEQFQSLFKQITEELSPDLILIDSRTGFNDIFGISAFRLSDMVVGFFANNIQTHPGIDFFLEILKQKNAPQLVAVNSVISETGKKQAFKWFNEYIEDRLRDVSSDNQPNDAMEEKDCFAITTKYVSENSVLKNIGSPLEDPDDFVNLIKNKTFHDYNELFEYLASRFELRKIHIDIPRKDQKKKNKSDERSLREVKMDILNKLNEGMPMLYAEQINDYEEEYRSNRYFYRTCMIDLFNPSKLLVIGNKGTGKTYIYKSLKNQDIVNSLLKKANKESLDCRFIHMVDEDKQMYTEEFDDAVYGSNDSFFSKFWEVYIWNSIMMEKPYDYQTKLETFSFRNKKRAKEEILKIIKDNASLIAIEDDMMLLDEYLTKHNKRIIIIFDDLDNVVKPHLWSDRISPLISLCRRMKYNSILPKLFIRSDLFEKITNITNKNELKNRSISIEWTREELFAYFFKQVFSHSKDDFFTLMRAYNIFPPRYISDIKKKLEASGDQPPLDDYVLGHLCSVFFGQYADINNSDRYPETYKWFYNNLRNANDTLSLRPFIDLIKDALGYAIKEDKSEKPILPQEYYLKGSTRAKAVENHFKDLAKEKGNEDLNPIFKYINDKGGEYKKETLRQNEMYQLLDKIISTGQLQNTDRDSIISLLEINGIIREHHVRRRGKVYKTYQFAFLYKYYLGLKSYHW